MQSFTWGVAKLYEGPCKALRWTLQNFALIGALFGIIIWQTLILAHIISIYNDHEKKHVVHEV